MLTLVRNLVLQGWRNVEDDELHPFTKFSIVIWGDIADYVFLPDIDQENVSVAVRYVEREHGTCTCVSCEGGLCLSLSCGMVGVWDMCQL